MTALAARWRPHPTTTMEISASLSYRALSRPYPPAGTGWSSAYPLSTNCFAHKLTEALTLVGRPLAKPLVLPVYLYHGTSDIMVYGHGVGSTDAITKNGLMRRYHGTGVGANAGQRQHNAVYLTAAPDDALTYANWVCEKVGGYPVRLMVRFDRLDERALLPDESFLDTKDVLPIYYSQPLPAVSELTWMDSLLVGGTVAYAADIPARDLEVYDEA